MISLLLVRVRDAFPLAKIEQRLNNIILVMSSPAIALLQISQTDMIKKIAQNNHHLV